MEYLSKLPERLKYLMTDNSVHATDELSAKVHISGSTIRSWLRGETIPSMESTIALANFFECNLDYLVGRRDLEETVLPHPIPPFYPRLRKIMESQNISRYQITTKTNIQDSFFTNWARGSVPKLTSLCAIADYMHISLDYLVGRRDF